MLKSISKVLIVVAALAVALPQVVAADVSGKIRVIDGDTFDVRGVRIRLHGIDAPEQGQTCTTPEGATWGCGAWVTEAVTKSFDGKATRCEAVDTDRYGRMVARCFVGGRDVARSLVQDGLAMAYRKYAMDYVRDERKAAALDVGLHASDMQSPAQFRRAGGNAGDPPDAACPIKGNISASGTRIFHSPGQNHYDRTRISQRKGERWFCTPEEARAAGWRAARR